MSSNTNSLVRVLRVRVKDKHSGWLGELAREVNVVWNYCNELQTRHYQRERRLLSGFDFWPYLKGCTRDKVCDGNALQLPVQSVQETAEQYAKSRKQQKKTRLAWRKSRGSRRSLGWIPFKVRTIRYEHGQIYFAGRWLSIWDSWGLQSYQLRAGNFSEDARGRWYLNVSVHVSIGEREKPTESGAVGIDLGLKHLAVMNDGTKIDNSRFYAQSEAALARAQRARNKQRTAALNAKIANRRRDYLHKFTTELVRNHRVVCVGDVSAARLVRGRHSKSILDAGWGLMRAMLRYKCDYAAAWFIEVPERGTTYRCSLCGGTHGPTGTAGLAIRVWTCSECGATHDRDVNAACNILAKGLQILQSNLSAMDEAQADDPLVSKASGTGDRQVGAGHGPLAAGSSPVPAGE